MLEHILNSEVLTVLNLISLHFKWLPNIAFNSWNIRLLHKHTSVLRRHKLPASTRNRQTVFCTRCQQSISCYFQCLQSPQRTEYVCCCLGTSWLLFVLTNNKHFHVTYFMPKVIASPHTVRHWYLIVLSCFSNIKTHKRSWSALIWELSSWMELYFHSSEVIAVYCDK